ncbi:hypothetical protein VUR80DRAFT_9858 [Thermomyces stellatus]
MYVNRWVCILRASEKDIMQSTCTDSGSLAADVASCWAGKTQLSCRPLVGTHRWWGRTAGGDAPLLATVAASPIPPIVTSNPTNGPRCPADHRKPLQEIEGPSPSHACRVHSPCRNHRIIPPRRRTENILPVNPFDAFTIIIFLFPPRPVSKERSASPPRIASEDPQDCVPPPKRPKGDSYVGRLNPRKPNRPCALTWRWEGPAGVPPSPPRYCCLDIRRQCRYWRKGGLFLRLGVVGLGGQPPPPPPRLEMLGEGEDDILGQKIPRALGISLR